MKRIGMIYSDRYLEHDTGSHVENIERLRSIRSHLLEQDWADDIEWVEPREATVDEVALVHSKEYMNYVKNACAGVRGISYLNPDTAVSRESYDVALLAAGGALEGIDRVMDGRLDGFFGLVRPPGHHAEHGESLGFCLFNNVAVGALYARQKFGVERVFILDWDVHHGNGTQHSFENDASVFYCSLHQYPHYPGTGARDEMGVGSGTGFTLNLPMRTGSEDADYMYLYKEVITKAIRKYEPQLLLISAGYDAHRSDPLSGVMLSDECFGAMMDSLARAAGPGCRVGLLLEGGYNLAALARSVTETVGVFGEYIAPADIRGSASPAALGLGQFIKNEHPFFKDMD